MLCNKAHELSKCGHCEAATLRAELAKYRECVKNPGSAMEWIAVMQADGEALRAENATLIKALAHERVRNGELRAEVLDVRESLSAAESREVCTVAHDGDVATCGYCQRDALRARVAELECVLDGYRGQVVRTGPRQGNSHHE